MELIVAEKPSVARDIARVLGCKANKKGALCNEQYAIVAAVGHIVGQCDPGEVNPEWKSWRQNTLPMLPPEIPLKILPKTKSAYDTIKTWMHDEAVETIICATDAGREGELIFRWIYQAAKCKKPIRRLWISSMTAQAIKEGFDKLAPGTEFDDLYAAAACRAQADWLVGMNASRAYSLRWSQNFSIGRVQTPTLAFLVRRQAEIDNFVPVEYATVTADFGAYKGKLVTEAFADGRIFDIELARAAAERAKGQEGTITSVETTPESIPPPLLFDLTSLQREANVRFKYTAKKTLELAQALYEKHKCITYPRTDSRYLTKDLIPTLPKRLAGLPDEYAKLTAPLLAMEKLPITGRIVQDAKVHDHHAITPTEKPLPPGATVEEKNLYDLVARSLISAFYPNCESMLTKVVTQVAGDDYLARGKVLLQAGWQAVWPPSKRKKDEEETLPELHEGETYPVKDVSIESKKTSPPKPYTDATLLAAMAGAGRGLEDEALREHMRECGLGTPATRAAIIERLIQVGYVQRLKNALAPTDKGKQLIGILPDSITDPATTAKWERALSRMQQGDMAPEAFLGSIGRFCQFLVADAKGQRA